MLESLAFKVIITFSVALWSLFKSGYLLKITFSMRNIFLIVISIAKLGELRKLFEKKLNIFYITSKNDVNLKKNEMKEIIKSCIFNQGATFSH